MLLCILSRIQTAPEKQDWNKDTRALGFSPDELTLQKYTSCRWSRSQIMNGTWSEHHVVNSPVIPNIESVEALCEALHVVGADFLQKVNIVFWVEATHVMLWRFIWFKHLSGGGINGSLDFNYLVINHLEIMSVKVSAIPSFSCRVHSVTPDYGSETDGEASWDAPHLHR